MIIVVKFLMLTAMSLGTAALYRVPKHLIPWGGFCGGVGGSMLLLLQGSFLNPVVATFIAACLIGALSEFLARWKKQPVSIFLIPGFIPLVPGRYAYMTMRSFVESDLITGLSLAVHTLSLAGAIAFGIFLSGTIYRIFVYRSQVWH